MYNSLIVESPKSQIRWSPCIIQVGNMTSGGDVLLTHPAMTLTLPGIVFFLNCNNSMHLNEWQLLGKCICNGSGLDFVCQVYSVFFVLVHGEANEIACLIFLTGFVYLLSLEWNRFLSLASFEYLWENVLAKVLSALNNQLNYVIAFWCLSGIKFAICIYFNWNTVHQLAFFRNSRVICKSCMDEVESFWDAEVIEVCLLLTQKSQMAKKFPITLKFGF